MDKFLPFIAIFFCVIAVLVDFSSKFLSMVVDGGLLAIVILIIYLMRKSKKEK